jgi:hypothetical protein
MLFVDISPVLVAPQGRTFHSLLVASKKSWLSAKDAKATQSSVFSSDDKSNEELHYK